MFFSMAVEQSSMGMQAVLQSKRMRLELPDFSLVDLVQPPAPEEIPVAPTVSPSAMEEPCADDISEEGGALWCVKRTYNPSNIVRKRRHGYLARVRSKNGRNVLNRRRTKGRWRITA
jgi:large subunit ribosomal protein L34